MLLLNCDINAAVSLYDQLTEGQSYRCNNGLFVHHLCFRHDEHPDYVNHWYISVTNNTNRVVYGLFIAVRDP